MRRLLPLLLLFASCAEPRHVYEPTSEQPPERLLYVTPAHPKIDREGFVWVRDSFAPELARRHLVGRVYKVKN
jgi:hypothetical protein